MTIPILFGVTFIVFTIMSFTPGNPGQLVLSVTASQEAIDQFNREIGFDRPFPIRFFNYVRDIVTRFDFGKSYRTNRPVFDDIALRFPYTLRLAVLAVFGAALIGMPLGVISAVKQNSLADRSITFIALFLAAAPGFWLGLMLIYWFAMTLGMFPTNGAETWRHYVLPLVTLIFPSAASMMRLTRTTMLESIRQDYIRTARAKGAPESRVIFVHALKNSLLPLITSLGMSFGAMLGGAIIAEQVFAIPGLGLHMLTAIRMKDIPVVMACTIFLAAIFCLIILVIDLIYAFVDPRIKARYSR